MSTNLNNRKYKSFGYIRLLCGWQSGKQPRRAHELDFTLRVLWLCRTRFSADPLPRPFEALHPSTSPSLRRPNARAYSAIIRFSAPTQHEHIKSTPLTPSLVHLIPFTCQPPCTRRDALSWGSEITVNNFKNSFSNQLPISRIYGSIRKPVLVMASSIDQMCSMGWVHNLRQGVVPYFTIVIQKNTYSIPVVFKRMKSWGAWQKA